MKKIIQTDIHRNKFSMLSAFKMYYLYCLEVRSGIVLRVYNLCHVFFLINDFHCFIIIKYM